MFNRLSEDQRQVLNIVREGHNIFITGQCSKSCQNFRKERKGGNDYFNLVFTYIIFNMGDMAISRKRNFEKLLRK